MKEDRRRHDRIVIPEDKLLSCEGVSRPLTGKISVLGTGGMYVRTTDTFPAGTELELRIRTEEDTLETPCVVRDVAPGGLGVEFTWVRGPLEEKLKKLMTRLKP
jgi:hypothetical protein